MLGQVSSQSDLCWAVVMMSLMNREHFVADLMAAQVQGSCGLCIDFFSLFVFIYLFFLLFSICMSAQGLAGS